MKVKTIDPATEQILAEYEPITKDIVDNAVIKATEIFNDEWNESVYKSAAHLYHGVIGSRKW